MAHGVIYGLHDPETGELRYVGQTIKSVSQRLSAHVCPSSLRKHSYLARWLLALTKRELVPTWSVLAEAQDQKELDSLEIEYIAKGRAEGVRLVNLTNGGGGRAGYILSQETKNKISAGNLGRVGAKHTEDWKARMSLLMSGKCTAGAEHIKKLAEMKMGVPRTDETKSLISKAKKGRPSGREGARHTDAAKAKISKGRAGILLGSTHHQYRHDISTEEILKLLAGGLNKTQVASHLNVSTTFIHRRLKKIR